MAESIFVTEAIWKRVCGVTAAPFVRAVVPAPPAKICLPPHTIAK